MPDRINPEPMTEEEEKVYKEGQEVKKRLPDTITRLQQGLQRNDSDMLRRLRERAAELGGDE